MGSGIFSQPHREAIRSLDHTGALKLSKVNYVLPCDSNMSLTFFWRNGDNIYRYKFHARVFTKDECTYIFVSVYVYMALI
jgi:hypothetical protein